MLLFFRLKYTRQNYEKEAKNIAYYKLLVCFLRSFVVQPHVSAMRVCVCLRATVSRRITRNTQHKLTVCAAEKLVAAFQSVVYARLV